MVKHLTLNQKNRVQVPGDSMKETPLDHEVQKEVREILEELSKVESFETGDPHIFFKCNSGVFIKGGENSLCYTTSQLRASVLTAILNEWKELRNKPT